MMEPERDSANRSTGDRRFGAVKWSLSWKLALIMALILAVTLPTVVYFMVNKVDSAITSRTGDEYRDMARGGCRSMELFWAEREREMKALLASRELRSAIKESNSRFARDPAAARARMQEIDRKWTEAPESAPFVSKVLDPAQNPASEVLKEFLRKFPNNVLIAVANRYGELVASTAKTNDYDQSDENWWKSGWNGGRGKVYIEITGERKEAENPSTMFALPVIDPATGSVVGVLGAIPYDTELESFLEMSRFGEPGYMAIVNGEGDIKMIIGPGGDKTDAPAIPEKVIEEVVSGQTGSEVDQDKNGFVMGFSGYTGLAEIAGDDENANLRQQAAQALLDQGYKVVVFERPEVALAVPRDIVRSVQTTGFLVGAIALALCLVVAFFFMRGITGPLSGMVQKARNIARGELGGRVPVTSNDEIGDFAIAFNEMNESLANYTEVLQQISQGDLTMEVMPNGETDQIGNTISTTLSNLKRMIGEISEGVEVLASSSAQIMSTTSQLVASVSETSTACGQTSTTAEEVKQTAKLVDEKARVVSERSEEALTASREGSTSVEQSLDVMEGIQTQMGSIGETIVKLSEQSQMIGEIIASVNEIAEQSNLLAVNASIEAAKAGEYGRGFAVVAQEIRTLSSNSKEATAQIRSILSDIQKSVSRAVMVTEQGARAVDHGVDQSKEAGKVFAQLVESVNRVSEASVQIAVSAQQQLTGMDQVVSAMENIREASNQNLASTQQTEVTAQNLHGLGERLTELVRRFKT